MIKKADNVLVNLYLDNVCNLKCSYCFEEKNIIGDNNDDLDSVVDFLDELLEKEPVMIDMCGREMSVSYPKYDYVLSMVKNKHNIIHLNVITNGYNAPEGFIIFLIKHKVKFLTVSLDLGKRVHDINRRTRITDEPTYDRILNNINTYKKIGVRMSVSSVYDPKNKPTYDEFSKHIDNIVGCGFKSYKLAFLNDTSPDSIEDVNYLYDIVFRKMLELHKNNTPMPLRLGSGFDIPRLREYFTEKFTIDCNARRSVTFSPGSKKYSCMLALANPDNFKTKELFEVRNGLYGNELIKHATNNFFCMKCEVNVFCRGACPMLHIGDGVNVCIEKRMIHAEFAIVYWYKLFQLENCMDIINRILSNVGKQEISLSEFLKFKKELTTIAHKLFSRKEVYREFA